MKGFLNLRKHSARFKDTLNKKKRQWLEELTQEVDRLEKATASVPARSEAPLTIQRIPLPLATGRYHEVQPGDTLYPIAQQYGTSVHELCRLNNISPDQVSYPGQKLLIAAQGNQ